MDVRCHGCGLACTDARQSEPLRRIAFVVLEQEILLRLQKQGGKPDLWPLAERRLGCLVVQQRR